MPTRRLAVLLTRWICVLVVLTLAAPAVGDPAFNRLVQKKAALEKAYGIHGLECFPFEEKIGFDEDQARRVEWCLKGLNTLSAALQEVPDANLDVVGISTRFLRTGGFNILLVPWNARREEMVQAMRDILPPEEQTRFLERIFQLKLRIQSRFKIRDLYCTRRIANEDCLRGYETLASIPLDAVLREKMWSEVAITDTLRPMSDPTILPLRFDLSAEAMAERLRTATAQDLWNKRRRTYTEIRERYGDLFRNLQLPNLNCAMDLTHEECLKGAANLFKASKHETLRRKKWGELLIHRYNTFIRNDYDATLRFDLPPAEIVRVFSRKPDKSQVEEQVTLAEKLENRTRNNTARLRAVCDLTDLRSKLCVRSFQNFITFLRTHPGFRVRPPWTELMFIDGTQLSRVNFALNSKVRNTYLYIDAHSSYEDMERFLLAFGEEATATR